MGSRGSYRGLRALHARKSVSSAHLQDVTRLTHSEALHLEKDGHDLQHIAPGELQWRTRLRVYASMTMQNNLPILPAGMLR